MDFSVTFFSRSPLERVKAVMQVARTQLSLAEAELVLGMAQPVLDGATKSANYFVGTS